MDKITPYWKALLGFIAPGAVLIGSAVTDGSQGGSRITTSEWVTAVVACVVTSAAVGFGPSNKPAGAHRAEAGNVDVGLGLLVAVTIGVTLLLFRVHFR
jgi:hypothetical protein